MTQANHTTTGVTLPSGSTGVFKIDQAEHFSRTLKGPATGNTLDLGDINIAGASLTYSGTTTRGPLTGTDGATAAKIIPLGNYTQAQLRPPYTAPMLLAPRTQFA